MHEIVVEMSLWRNGVVEAVVVEEVVVQEMVVEEEVVAVDLQILLGNLLLTELLQARHEFLPKRQRSSQWTTFRQPIKYGTGS